MRVLLYTSGGVDREERERRERRDRERIMRREVCLIFIFILGTTSLFCLCILIVFQIFGLFLCFKG